VLIPFKKRRKNC